MAEQRKRRSVMHTVRKKKQSEFSRYLPAGMAGIANRVGGAAIRNAIDLAFRSKHPVKALLEMDLRANRLLRHGFDPKFLAVRGLNLSRRAGNPRVLTRG